MNFLDISDKAQRYFLAHIKKEKACGVKLVMRPDGCAGYGYNVSFPSEVNNNDICFEINSLKVFVDLQSKSLLQGTMIDLKSESVGQKQIVFNNPQVKSSCGCGLSVQIDDSKDRQI